MATGTFPRFLHLPFELQVHIWQYATDEAVILDELDDPDCKPSVVATAEHNHYQCYLFSGPRSGTTIYGNKTYDHVFDLMKASRLSRWLMLKRWRELIRADVDVEWWDRDDYWEMLDVLGGN